MRSFLKIVSAVPAVLAALAAADASAQWQYDATGVSGFIQDFDPDINLHTALAGTWSASFEIDPGALTLLSNVQNQGGSWTRYGGVVLSHAVLHANIGEIVVTDSDVTGVLSLWDRASFGDGQRQVFLDFDINGTLVRWDLVANANHALYDSIFNVGTPGPNTFKTLPDFVGGGVGLFVNSTLSVDGATPNLEMPILPGQGRYFGGTDTLTFIPSPASLALFALGGLATTRRRRG